MRPRALRGGRRRALLRRKISARLWKYAQLRPLDRHRGSWGQERGERRARRGGVNSTRAVIYSSFAMNYDAFGILPPRTRRNGSNAESAYFFFNVVVDVSVLVAVLSATDKRSARPLRGPLARAPQPARDPAPLYFSHFPEAACIYILTITLRYCYCYYYSRRLDWWGRLMLGKANVA